MLAWTLEWLLLGVIWLAYSWKGIQERRRRLESFRSIGREPLNWRIPRKEMAMVYISYILLWPLAIIKSMIEWWMDRSR